LENKYHLLRKEILSR